MRNSEFINMKMIQGIRKPIVNDEVSFKIINSKNLGIKGSLKQMYAANLWIGKILVQFAIIAIYYKL